MANRNDYQLSPKEISKMNDSELRKLLNKMNAVANKRLSRLEISGAAEYSWSYAAIVPELKGQGKFKTPKDATRQELVNRAKLVNKFLSHKTSTVTGAKQEEIRIQDMFGNLSKKGIRRVTNIVAQIKRKNLALFDIVGSERVMKFISQTVQRDSQKSEDELLSEAESYMFSEYANQQNEDIVDDGIWLG